MRHFRVHSMRWMLAGLSCLGLAIASAACTGSGTETGLAESTREMPTLTREPTVAPTAEVAEPIPTVLPAELACDLGLDSPDTQWRVLRCYDDEANRSYSLEILKADNSRHTSIEYVPDDHQWLESFFIPVEWAIDSSSLFFSISPQCCIPPDLQYFDGAGLFRVWIETGRIEQLLPAESLHSFALSDDQSNLAAICIDCGEPLELVILDIEGRRQMRIELPALYTSAGSIVWYYDGSKLAFAMAQFSGMEEPASAEGTALAVVDLVGRNLLLVAENDPRIKRPIRWHDDTHVLSRSADRREWQINVLTGEILPAE